MSFKPNQIATAKTNDYPSDLYRRFERIFSIILNPDTNTYENKNYCKTRNSLEDRVKIIMNSYSDCVVPILGYTGIGKTSLMHYCIKGICGMSDDLTLKNKVFFDDKRRKLFLYASYDSFRRKERNENESFRIGGKLGSAANLLINNILLPQGFPNDKKKIAELLACYIRDNKPELLDENAGSVLDSDYKMLENLFKKDMVAYNAEKLKWALTNYDTGVKDLILILDDVEGVLYKNTNDAEYGLIHMYLDIYDCLRRIDRDKNTFRVKLFICMRSRTYNEIKKTPWYDTHRSNYTFDPLTIESGVDLSTLFVRRFDDIEGKLETRNTVRDIESWDSARKIMKNLCSWLDTEMRTDIMKLCNYNVGDAIQMFANILSNRRWTQNNDIAQPGFKIDEYNFYLSRVNGYRAIAMKNADVYYNDSVLPNLFFDNDRNGFCLPIYIITLFYEKNDVIKEYSKKQICSIFQDLMKWDDENKVSYFKKINDIILYYAEEEILFEKTKIHRNGDIENVLYLSPKGAVLYTLLFENTLLMELYRDDLYLRDDYKKDGSFKMKREELFLEVMDLIIDISDEEKNYYRTIKVNDTTEVYNKYFGHLRIAKSMLEAINKTLNKYYKNGSPTEISDKLNALCNRIM